jgi:hypothetical protein
MEIYLCVVKYDCDTNPKTEILRCLDELLDVYSLYLQTGIESVKEEVIRKAYQLHVRDPQFSFVV